MATRVTKKAKAEEEKAEPEKKTRKPAAKKASAGAVKQESPVDAAEAKPTPEPVRTSEPVPQSGVDFHAFVFRSTPIEEAIFAHVVKRISQIQFPKLSYSHIRGAVHSWVSGTAVDDVILKLIVQGILEKTDYKGRPALQFKNPELRKYPVRKGDGQGRK